MKKNSKITLILCIAAALLLLILVIAFLAGRSIYADSEVKRVPPSEINFREAQSARKKVGETLSRIGNASTGSAAQTLVISQTEFNALTESLLNLAGMLAKDMKWNEIRLQDTALLLNDDSVRLIFSKDTGVNTPFGSKVKATVNLEIALENGASRFRIKSATLGTMPMPAVFRERIETELTRFQQSREHKLLLDSVESLAIEHGELRIRYRPYEAKQNIPSPLLQGSRMLLSPFGGKR